MRLRRILPLLTLIALLLAPFGRMATVEAAVMPHHAALAAPPEGCADAPAPDQDRGGDESAIDCFTACAVMTPGDAPALAVALAAALPARPATPRDFAGIAPEAEPPPPRVS